MLASYMVSINLETPLPVWLFWVTLVLIACLVIWQIKRVDGGTYRSSIILCEILALGFVLNLMTVFTAPYGLFGRDVHHQYRAAATILQYGWPVPGEVSMLEHTSIYSGFPAIHFLGGALSKIMGVPMFSIYESFCVVKWLPLLISISTVAMVYLLVQRIFNRVQASLLAAFGVSMINNQVLLHSLFVQETLAVPLLLLFLYFYARCITYQGRTITNYFLAFLCFASLLLTHHLTPFILVALLAILVVSIFFVRGVGRRLFKWPTPVNIQSPKAVSIVFIVTAVCLCFYLLTFSSPIFQVLVTANKNLVSLDINNVSLDVTPSPVDTTIVSTDETPSSADITTVSADWANSVKRKLLLAFNFILVFMFSIFIAIQIKRNKEANVVWDIWGIGFGVVAAFLYGAGRFTPGFPFVGHGRIEFFAWLFVLFPVAHFLAITKKMNWAMYILVPFVLFQVYQIPAYIYNHNAEPDQDVRMSYSLATYRSVEWFDDTGIIVGDLTVDELFSGLKQALVLNSVNEVGIFEGRLEGIAQYDWLIVRAENDKYIKVSGDAPPSFRLTPEVREKYDSSPALNKVYENPDVIIYKVRKDVS
jgi:hypothetical protein